MTRHPQTWHKCIQSGKRAMPIAVANLIETISTIKLQHAWPFRFMNLEYEIVLYCRSDTLHRPDIFTLLYCINTCTDWNQDSSPTVCTFLHLTYTLPPTLVLPRCCIHCYHTNTTQNLFQGWTFLTECKTSGTSFFIMFMWMLHKYALKVPPVILYLT